jgi:hypothetical protein
MEAYRNQNGLTQCYNFQKFSHIWAHCNRPPRFMWCGGGHLHKDCPEKSNKSSTQACCNCKLVDGEKPHPSKYRSCSDAKDEVQRRNAQRTRRSQRGGCSPSIISRQVWPSRRLYEKTRGYSSSLIRTGFL